MTVWLQQISYFYLGFFVESVIVFFNNPFRKSPETFLQNAGKCNVSADCMYRNVIRAYINIQFEFMQQCFIVTVREMFYFDFPIDFCKGSIGYGVFYFLGFYSLYLGKKFQFFSFSV